VAIKNIIDPEAARARLEHWLERRLDGATEVIVTNVVVPRSSGLSCETVLFDARWQQRGQTQERRLVARVAPDPASAQMMLFPSYDLEQEARIMRGLRQHTRVLAPHVAFTESDPAVLGGPFLVMDRIDGRVPPDDPPYTMEGWVLDLDPADQRKLVENAVDVLVALHEADWRDLGLQALDRSERGPIGISQYIGTIEHLDQTGAGGRPHPTIDAGFAWVAEHRPSSEGPAVLNWGDTRIGNLMFGEAVEVVGVLDWEMACLASREQDLGYLLFGLDFVAAGLGLPSPPGFPTEEEIVARYAAGSGHTVADLEYYKALSSLMATVMLMRIGYVMIEGGLMPADSPFPHNNPASQTMARYMDLPAPSGDLADWTGVR
jgi:aminoglycoside phosphotransferase (APT) family kinase protein